jgi:hypothetical protein
MSPGEAKKAIIELIQFVLANSEIDLSSLPTWTIPQINAKAESIRKYRIHAWGVGLGGKDKEAPQLDREHTKEDALSFVAQFAGLN